MNTKAIKTKTKTGNDACMHHLVWIDGDRAWIDKRILLPKEDDSWHFNNFFKPLRIGRDYILYQQLIVMSLENLQGVMGDVIELMNENK